MDNSLFMYLLQSKGIFLMVGYTNFTKRQQMGLVQNLSHRNNFTKK